MLNVSILDEVLIEEYERSERIKQMYLDRIQSLPKGYLSYKKIKGKIYVYLQERQGDKIISQFIPKEQVEILQKQIDERRRYQKGLREIREEQKKIKKVVGLLV